MPVIADVQDHMLVLQYGHDRYGLRRFLVQSEQLPNKFYKLHERAPNGIVMCECEAFMHKPFTDCKHIRAVRKHLNEKV